MVRTWTIVVNHVGIVAEDHSNKVLSTKPLPNKYNQLIVIIIAYVLLKYSISICLEIQLFANIHPHCIFVL